MTLLNSTDGQALCDLDALDSTNSFLCWTHVGFGGVVFAVAMALGPAALGAVRARRTRRDSLR